MRSMLARITSSLAAGVVWAYVATADAASPAPAAIPATLQTLEAKMRQLQVNSERFSQVSRGYIRVANESNGKVVGRVKRISVNAQLIGEASLSPSRSETFLGARRMPEQIVIGSTVYTREGGGRRPWVRRHEPKFAQSLTSFPFHGDPEELDLGGTGSYAGLLNLLAIAVGQVRAGAAAVIDGQSTETFSASVEPTRLIKGLTKEDEGNLKRHPLIERLEVFLTEAGLPIRVVQTLDSLDIHETVTTQILDVNVPVNVKAPPARETTG
ncbi:MAG TPA: hypothetical protein VEJ23_04080 [Solirubrobacteraceae bacterium]|nr:hypothetical protein [Solirubrobacteraceae bacterium]